MNAKVQAKFDRIVQIQQEIFSLEKELAKILGDHEEGEPSGTKRTRRRVRRDILGDPLATRSRVSELILKESATRAAFTKSSIIYSAQVNGIKTNRSQVAALLRRMVESGKLVERPNRDGETMYSSTNLRPNVASTPPDGFYTRSV